MQDLKTLKVEFHHATKDEVLMHTISLPKESTVGDLINDLKTKVELSNPDAELRLLEVFNHRIYKWKFAYLSLGRPTYLQDSDVVFTHFQRQEVPGAWEQYLGLEHPNDHMRQVRMKTHPRN